MALAEKWRLTLVQPLDKTMSKSIRRKSYLSGVDMTGLLADNDFLLLENDVDEEVKVTEEDTEELPCVMVMDDDYFQTDQ